MSSATTVQTLPLRPATAVWEGALRLDEETVLLFAPVQFRLGQGDRLLLEDRELAPPYPGVQFYSRGGPYFLLLLSAPALRNRNTIVGLKRLTAGSAAAALPPYRLDDRHHDVFEQLMENCDNAALQKITAFFLDLSRERPAMRYSPSFRRLFDAARLRISEPAIQLAYGSWLSPHVLYLEGQVTGLWPETSPMLMIGGAHGIVETRARLCQFADKAFALIACIDQPIYETEYQEFQLAVLSGQTLFPVQGPLWQKAYGLEICHRLNEKSDHQKYLIREHISRFLLDSPTQAIKQEAGDLIRKLQRFLPATPVSCIDPSLPVNFHVENVLPIDNTGLFISGWMRDPFQMIERIDATSALGFTLRVSPTMHRFDRPDIEDGFRQSAFGQIKEKHGFLGYTPVPVNIQQRLSDIAKLHSLRFTVWLKGGGSYPIVPEPRHRDVWAARQFLLKSFPVKSITQEMLQGAFTPALTSLHQACLQEVNIHERVVYGTLPKTSDVTIIIPLYRNLSLVQSQLAIFANDPALRESMIVYVLDSPEQVMEAKAILKRCAALYNMPLTLAVLNKGGGFAHAVNLAAAEAKTPYLLILQSDVLPERAGWLTPLVEHFRTHEKVAAVSPMLMFEDGSLQQAGQYVARDGDQFMLAGRYQGYPRHAAAVQQNARVAMLDSACLLADREWFARVGGFTTDYITGNVESADFCLKAAQLGGQSWYVSGSQLYHLTKQSLFYNELYHDSLSQPYSEALFTSRWANALAALADAETTK